MVPMSFKEFSIFSFGGHFVWQSKTIWEILVEGSNEEQLCEIVFN